MTLAVSGIGAKFRRLVDSVYADLAEVINIKGPSPTRETIDVTNLDSTGGYREFIASLRDGGTVEMEMNFTRAGYEILKSDFESDVLGDYEIILPDAENTSFNFQGLVTDIPLDIAMDSQIKVSVTIKISGQVNLNSGSGSS